MYEYFFKIEKIRFLKRMCNKIVIIKSLRYKSYLFVLIGLCRCNIKIYDSCYE